MNYAFIILTWCLFVASAVSLLTQLGIAITVFNGTANNVNREIFTGTQQADTSPRSKPGITFTLLHLFDLAALNLIIALKYSAEISTYLAWSVLLLLLLCYVIKAVYFLHFFHRAGILDDDDLARFGLKNKERGITKR